MEYLQYLEDGTILETGKWPGVLNLVISGIPSILNPETYGRVCNDIVLNLVISGIPSIHKLLANQNRGYYKKF